MNDENAPGENELSRLFNLGDLGRHGVIMEIAAGPEERAALARRFDLVAVDSLVADVTIVRDEEDHMVHLRGSIAAEVVQACVVTLEPVASLVKGAIEMAYSTEAPAAGAVREMEPNVDVAPGEDDRPERLEGEEIDVGEVVAEHLGLHLDPYPRGGGVVFSTQDGAMDGGGDDKDDKDPSPFTVLRDLKGN